MRRKVRVLQEGSVLQVHVTNVYGVEDYLGDLCYADTTGRVRNMQTQVVHDSLDLAVRSILKRFSPTRGIIVKDKS